jgi:CHAD domain-containing protein
VAKPRPITGLDPDRRLRPNARRILGVRIDEVWAFAPYVTHPGHVRELHDMRIACKRLRYLLEIFEIAFPADLGPFIDQIKDLQDLLGEIHDRDVQVPMLHDHLERLAERDAAAARELVRETGPRGRMSQARREAAFERFRTQLDEAGALTERPGIEALLVRRTRERDELYDRFLMEWRRLTTERFRSGLERALGV